jgi:hypothetical protein
MNDFQYARLKIGGKYTGRLRRTVPPTFLELHGKRCTDRDDCATGEYIR